MAFFIRTLFSRLSSNTPLHRRQMSTTVAPFLVTPSQVQDLLKLSTPVSILDVSWFMPNVPRKPREEFLTKRLPGAQYLDLDEVASSHELGLSHMMPDGRVFAAACEKFGIEPSTHVIIYDTPGIFSAPRALFMFRAFGHENSSIIDGGLQRWASEGYPLETDEPTQPKETHYPVPTVEVNNIRSYEQIVTNSAFECSKPGAELVLDARPRGRFLGVDPEPRPGLPSGHIPNSFSLPFNLLLKTNPLKEGGSYTTFLPPQELRKALVESVGEEYADKLIKGEQPVTTSCGSGMTAGVVWLALKLLGLEKINLYDESWTGYAKRSTSKIDKSV